MHDAKEQRLASSSCVCVSLKWPSADVEHTDTVVCEMENALQRSHWSWEVDWVFRIANNIMKTASARQFSVSRKERKMDLSCLCQVT